ncbi:MAG: IS110 family transposase [Bacteroidetes bacterium]|nr:IS110 family transposase [Bacteroidota bacterium]
METKQIVGIDVSKETFDAVFENNSIHEVFSNSTKGFGLLVKWLLRHAGKGLSGVLVVMEHTGIYSLPLEKYLYGKHIAFSKVAGIKIKRSMGLVRGKSDAADAGMIARYGAEKRKVLTAQQPVQANVLRLKNLIALRDKMVRDRAGWIVRLSEQEQFLGLQGSDLIVKVQKAIVKGLDAGIDKVNNEITAVIEGDSALSQTYGLLVSIKGVGPVIAAYMIALTDNFKNFATWRQFACYSGIAPFPYESGKSIKGRTRVSNYANKKMKSLLHMAAMNAVKYNPEIRDYYEKRTNAGKNKMGTLNAIRCKIVARMFAVIKRQEPYKVEWLNAA